MPKGQDADLCKAVCVSLQTSEVDSVVLGTVAVADYRGSAWRYYSKGHCDWCSARNVALRA